MSGKRQDMKAGSEMNMGRVQTALSRLKSFQPGKGPDEDFVYLSAKFCDTLADSPTYEELRRRAAAYDRLTGPGSVFDGIRSEVAALCAGEDANVDWGEGELSTFAPTRLTIAALREADGMGLHPPGTIATPVERTTPKPLLPAKVGHPGGLAVWWCVGPETVHDAEWVRCNLCTVYAMTEYTIQSGYDFFPVGFSNAVVRFREELWTVWRQSDQDHSLGSYLLAMCQDAVNAGPAECERLIANLGELDVQARAACGAAEDLCHHLATLNQAGPDATGGQAEAGLGEPAPIAEVIVTFGERRCILGPRAAIRFR